MEGVAVNDADLSDLDRATLRLAAYELQYHGLRSAAKSVLSSRRPHSKAQCAVLTVLLDDLAAKAAQDTPGIDWREKP